MGKKSKLKQIRKIANNLPIINTNVAEQPEIIYSRDLITKGITHLKDGSKVLHDKKYNKKSFVEMPVNHNRKMKKLYNTYGKSGINIYLKAVNTYLKSKNIKESQTPPYSGS